MNNSQKIKHYIIGLILALSVSGTTKNFAQGQTPTVTQKLQIAAAVAQMPLAVMSELCRHKKTKASCLLQLAAALTRLSQSTLSLYNCPESGLYHNTYLCFDSLANAAFSVSDFIKAFESNRQTAQASLAQTEAYHKTSRTLLAVIEGIAALGNSLILEKSIHDVAARNKWQALAAMSRSLSEFLNSKPGTLEEKTLFGIALINTTILAYDLSLAPDDFIKYKIANALTGKDELFASEAEYKKRLSIYEKELAHAKALAKELELAEARERLERELELAKELERLKREKLEQPAPEDEPLEDQAPQSPKKRCTTELRKLLEEQSGHPRKSERLAAQGKKTRKTRFLELK